MTEAYDAIRIAIGRKSKEVASFIRYGWSTVQRWMLPRPSEERGEFQSGTRSPHEVVVDTYEGCTYYGQSREDSLAPIHWINERVRLGCFELPEVDATPEEIRTAFIKSSAEFGDVAKGIDKALDPKGPGGGNITQAEYKKNHREIMQVVRALMRYDSLMKEAASK